MGLGACDVMKEACSYVESVMTSQTVTPVIEIAEITENTKTPITNGRKRTLSAQSVDETVNKKVKNSSTENLYTKNEKRRVVNVRRNLAGKSNSKEIKSDGQSIYRNGRTNDEANTHRQRSVALKQTKRGRKETEIRVRQISNRTKSKENTKARNSGSKARRTVTRQLDTDYNSNKENRHATDTAVILEAVADLKSGIESKIDEIDRNNKESIRKVEAEIISIRNEFNKRIEGLTKKVEDRVRKVFEKDIEIAVEKATERNKYALEKSVKQMRKIYSELNKL